MIMIDNWTFRMTYKNNLKTSQLIQSQLRLINKKLRLEIDYLKKLKKKHKLLNKNTLLNLQELPRLQIKREFKNFNKSN